MCCCGCSIAFGIMTYAAIQLLGLAGAIVSISPFNILFSLVELTPLTILYLMPDNSCVRLLNYIWQWVQMGLIICMLTVFIVAIDAIIDMACSDDNIVAALRAEHKGQSFGLSDCEDRVRVPVYWVWLLAVLVLVPLQATWIHVFKSHYEELPLPLDEDKAAPNSAEYSRLPN